MLLIAKQPTGSYREPAPNRRPIWVEGQLHWLFILQVHAIDTTIWGHSTNESNYQMLCLCRILTMMSFKWRFATQLQKGFVPQTEHRDNMEKRNSHVHIGKILFAYCSKVVQEQGHLSDECVNLIPTTKFKAQLASILTTDMHQKACFQTVNAECWVEIEHDRITVSILVTENTSLLSKSNGYQRNRIQIKHRRSKYHWLLTQFHSRLRYLIYSFSRTENPKVVL